MATAVVASPLAYSTPVSGQRTQVTKFQGYSADAYGYFYDGYTDTSFFAQAYDDLSGVPQGYVSVVMYSPVYQYLSCYGPAYGKVVSVNQGNGNSSINATLDPTSPDCYSYNVDVSQRYVVKLTGKYNGDYRNSQNGTGKQTYSGENYKYNSQYDGFDETFTGTNGFYSGTFTGSAETQHYTNRTRVK